MLFSRLHTRVASDLSGVNKLMERMDAIRGLFWLSGRVIDKLTMYVSIAYLLTYMCFSFLFLIYTSWIFIYLFLPTYLPTYLFINLLLFIEVRGHLDPD